jgi:hypothetical protein
MVRSVLLNAVVLLLCLRVLDLKRKSCEEDVEYVLMILMAMQCDPLLPHLLLYKFSMGVKSVHHHHVSHRYRFFHGQMSSI